jgi:hypothetical protein
MNKIKKKIRKNFIDSDHFYEMN